MKLTLDRLDLNQQHKNVNCSLTRYEHFTVEVQAAIRAVGRATFREFDNSSYNAIYPPAPMLELCSLGNRQDIIQSAPLTPTGLTQLLNVGVKCPTTIWVGDRLLDHQRLDAMPAWNDADDFWQAYERADEI